MRTVPLILWNKQIRHFELLVHEKGVFLLYRPFASHIVFESLPAPIAAKLRQVDGSQDADSRSNPHHSAIMLQMGQVSALASVFLEEKASKLHSKSMVEYPSTASLEESHEEIPLVRLKNVFQCHPQAQEHPEKLSFVATIHSMQHHFAENDYDCRHPMLVMELHDLFPEVRRGTSDQDGGRGEYQPFFVEICSNRKASVLRYQPGQCIYVEV